MRKVGRILFQWGLVDMVSGNISVRSGDMIIITKTGASLPFLKLRDITSFDIKGKIPDDASSESEIHKGIYKKTSFKAVIHSHIPEAAAFQGEFFEPDDFEGKLFFGRVPVVEREKIPDTIGKGVAIAKLHGAFCAGYDIDESLRKTLALATSLKIFFLKKVL